MPLSFEGGMFVGTLYADFYLGGKWTGKQKAGNGTKFELKANAKREELISNERGPRNGQLLRAVTRPQPSSLNISINDPVREVLVVGFLGEGVNIAVVAGSVTSEVVAAPQPGKALSLAYREISAVAIARKNGEDAASWAATTAIALGAFRVPATANNHFYKCVTAGTTGSSAPTWPTNGGTVADGSVTWKDMGTIIAALNTDYTIGVDGARLGWITLTDDTRIEFEEQLSHDYAYAARTGYKIKGASQPIRKVRWFLDGERLDDGRLCYIEVYETQAMPTKAIDFLSANWQEIDIDAAPITPEGKDHPWSIEYLDEQAVV